MSYQQPISQVLRIPDPGTLAFGVTSARLQLRFPRSCWVVGLTLACGEGQGAGERLGAQILIADGAQKAIISDGLSEAFAPFALLCPPDGSASAADIASPLALVRRVRADETWSFVFKNAGSVGLGNITMQGALLLADDSDVMPEPACTHLPWLSRVLMVPGFASLGVNETSPQALVEFPSDGLVVGMRASAFGVRRDAMAVELYDPERREVITTGIRAMAPVPLPLMAPGNDCTLPLSIPRRAHDKLTARVQNLSAATAFTPNIGFFYQDCGC